MLREQRSIHEKLSKDELTYIQTEIIREAMRLSDDTNQLAEEYDSAVDLIYELREKIRVLETQQKVHELITTIEHYKRIIEIRKLHCLNCGTTKRLAPLATLQATICLECLDNASKAYFEGVKI